MPTVQFTMRVDADLKAAFHGEAQKQDMSASQVATRAIRAHFDARSPERSAVEAALGKTDKGKLTSEEAFVEWVESWDTDRGLPMPKAD